MDLDRIGTRHRDNSHTYVAESEALDQISKVVSDHFTACSACTKLDQMSAGLGSLQNLLQADFSQCSLVRGQKPKGFLKNISVFRPKKNHSGVYSKGP